jgi:thiol:disulfide interchange protein DsbD
MSGASIQRFSLTFLLSFVALSTNAAHTQARLILAAETAKPGETVMAGIHLRMDPKWHTYWKNPGGAGIATTVKWDLPAGVTAGEIQWPIPRKLPDPEFTTYVYDEEVVLLVPLTVAADVRDAPLELKAKVDWLECESKCIPGSAQVSAVLKPGGEIKPSADAPLIAAWQKKLPRNGDTVSPHAWWEKASTEKLRSFIVEWASKASTNQLDFFPYTGKGYEVDSAHPLSAPSGKAQIRVQLRKGSGEWPKEVGGLLVEQITPEPVAYDAKLTIADAAPSGAQTTAAVGGSSGRQPLWLILFEAFVGGLILNIMPCVLPVIALKILGFVKDAGHQPGRVRKLGLIYTAGVLLSFLCCGAVVVIFQTGWGVQFGNPYFLIGITTLVTLIALNLFGVFEVTLVSGAASAAGTLASKHGSVGAFFNGLLTTVLATSCSAPFFAAAIGFATTLDNRLITLLIFLTAGLGLAAPYLILSWNPAWLRFLPKPGSWMQRFKIAMGFPMLATAIWLCSLTATHYPDGAMWMGMFLVFVALAAWVYGEFVQRGGENRWPGRLIAAGLLLAGYAFALENRLQWRHPIKETSASEASTVAPKGVAWERWSPEAVAAARASGRPVVVDFTADWCPNCNIIIKRSFEDASVQKKMKETNTLPLVADYSKQPPEITAELKRFGRAAVPMVLVYSPKLDEDPQVFDLVWASTLVKALDRAVRPDKRASEDFTVRR